MKIFSLHLVAFVRRPLVVPMLSHHFRVFYRHMTRGEHLAYCISYALIRARKVVRGLGLSLSKEEREAVADAAVDFASMAIRGSWARNCLRRASFIRRRRVIETAPAYTSG